VGPRPKADNCVEKVPWCRYRHLTLLTLFVAKEVAGTQILWEEDVWGWKLKVCAGVRPITITTLGESTGNIIGA
jgi:hypothetical protein